MANKSSSKAKLESRAGIQCPECDYTDSSVEDSRAGNNQITRRRKCKKCGSQFQSIEKAECDIEFIEDDEGEEDEIAFSA